MRTGALDDINSAIDAHQRLLDIAVTSESVSFVHKTMDGLGMCFVMRHDSTGDMSDLEQGIDYLETVIAMSEEGSDAYWDSSIHLGNALAARFQRSNRIEDLDRAVDLGRRASLSPREGHAQSTLTASNNLAIALYERYRHLSKIEDLEEAIAVQRCCVRDSGSIQGLPGLPGRLTNLSSFLEQRYQHLENTQDIREALQAQHHALELTADDDAILPSRLTNMALAYNALFEATKDPSALQTCIDLLKRSLTLIPEQHPLLPLILSNLGIALARQASQGDSAAFDEAVQTLTRVTETTPAGHRAEADRWNSLGTLWHMRFRQTREPTALSEASSAFQRALELTPEGHASSATRLSRMADIHASRYASSQNEADLQEAVENWRRAVSSSASSPETRFKAALCWAQLERRHNPQESLAAWDAAVELVPLMIGLGETVSQRTKALAKISDVALQAASIAFSVDRPDKALQWLEQARCLIWTQLHALKSPVEELRLHNPELADRLQTLSDALHRVGFRTEESFDSPNQTSDDTITLQDETRDHRRMAREWDELLTEIRQIPGLEYFLLPPPTSQLFEHLPSGPVVLINVSADRCDALVLIPGLDEPIHIPLPLLTEEMVEGMASRLRTHLVSLSLLVRGGVALEVDEALRAFRPTGSRARDELKRKSAVLEGILHQLWIFAVKPVLDALGFSPSDSPDSRIWWCTTGALSFLPIHAAGIYSGPDAVAGESTLSDFVISSYTPTVTALSNRVKQAMSSEPLAPGLLLVSQPSAPGLPSIPLTSLEVKAIRELAERASVDTTVLDGHDATIQNCVSGMKSSSCVHLACHGIQDQHNPLKSGFFLHGGQLELSDIVQGDVKAADFAFLSACQTSTGDYRVPEEAIHLAAGMLAVGYKSVVGTMWSIVDEVAPKVSEEFYKHLLSANDPQNPTQLNIPQTAEALHHSTKLLRKKMGTSDAAFLAWVPYVHFGL
ncbi:CHAT domain-containing protein [Coprinopsis sp. MPI-PUGE-AT-0042]|nr:CHAT domain-containing protein [Coprinopsis sp. MPI-PUGE-AT-0042]